MNPKNGLAILSILMLMGTPLVSACYLTLSPNEGLMTMVSGTSYPPSTTIKIYWNGIEMKTIPITIGTDATGKFTALVVALNQTQGEYEITALSGSANFTVPDLKGETGLTGEKGERGFSGADGKQGVQGVQGIQGIQGIQGVKGDIGLNGMTGLTGLTGAMGLKGDQGIQGLQGLQGVAGLNGVDGKDGKDASGIVALVALALAFLSALGVGYSLWFKKD